MCAHHYFRRRFVFFVVGVFSPEKFPVKRERLWRSHQEAMSSSLYRRRCTLGSREASTAEELCQQNSNTFPGAEVEMSRRQHRPMKRLRNSAAFLGISATTARIILVFAVILPSIFVMAQGIFPSLIFVSCRFPLLIVPSNLRSSVV